MILVKEYTNKSSRLVFDCLHSLIFPIQFLFVFAVQCLVLVLKDQSSTSTRTPAMDRAQTRLV